MHIKIEWNVSYYRRGLEICINVEVSVSYKSFMIENGTIPTRIGNERCSFTPPVSDQSLKTSMSHISYAKGGELHHPRGSDEGRGGQGEARVQEALQSGRVSAHDKV